MIRASAPTKLINLHNHMPAPGIQPVARIVFFKFQRDGVFELIVILAGNREQVCSRHVHDGELSILESESIGSRLKRRPLPAEFGLSNKEALKLLGDRGRVSRSSHQSRQHEFAGGILKADRVARLWI